MNSRILGNACGGPPAHEPIDFSFVEGTIDLPGNLDALGVSPRTYEAAAQLFSLVAAYCDGKARAMRFRLAGDVEAAVSYERALEAQYKRFPRWAQW